MEQELHTELFDIRRVAAEDRELFSNVVAAEYLMGKLYKQVIIYRHMRELTH